MDMNTTTNTKPVQVWFSTDRRGKVAAYRWSMMQFRSFRISVDEARELVATEQAIDIKGHPFPGKNAVHAARGRVIR